ncbi:ATP-binding cassette domain-containing protein [Lactobacillus sp. ESL0684]|uniref:ATP-binding cassette domain-containing protein n=1 Tax=Lactobacillus sp. ESL0684 TaxID=2983213 RepID=UPI0023F91456|nr:ATP-binding cassette domain-containing protein [Lactobacillus sp. ESL0684]WEV44137.1 ATP-binding cassette domain-containing protein [Lactobacillus sp. ESL0684]
MKYNVLQNLGWLRKFMKEERLYLESWPLLSSIVKLVSSILDASLPAVVIWAFSESHITFKFSFLVALCVLTGILTWFDSWYNRKMFWENTKLTMRLDIEDAELYYNEPFADSLSNKIQDRRFSDTQYAFFNENSGAGIFIPSLVKFISSAASLVVISILTIKISPIVLVIIAISVGFSYLLLRQLTIKRNKIRTSIDAEQLTREYYLKTSYDEGINFSGGELQKIAIARVAYRKSEFYVLDEPTSALDPISEEEVFNQFEQLTHHKSALFISHRMSSTRKSDYIYVFNQGELVEQGNHNKLVSLKGLYYKLYKAQSIFFTSND